MKIMREHVVSDVTCTCSSVVAYAFSNLCNVHLVKVWRLKLICDRQLAKYLLSIDRSEFTNLFCYIETRCVVQWIRDCDCDRVEELMKERSSRAALLADAYLGIAEYLQLAANSTKVSLLVLVHSCT
jgi:hypothetical protein